MGLLRRLNDVVGTAQVTSLGSGTITSTGAPVKNSGGWFQTIFSGTNALAFRTGSIIADSSGNIVILVNSYNNRPILYKFNPAGQIIWTRAISRGSSSIDTLYTMNLTTDGTDYYVVTEQQTNAHQLTKVTSAGAISWVKLFTAGGQLNPSSVIVNFNNYVVVSGHTSAAGNTNYDMYYAGYDRSSGTLSYQRRTRHPDGNTTLFKGQITTSPADGWMWSTPTDGASSKTSRATGVLIFATSPTGGGAQKALHYGNATGSGFTLSLPSILAPDDTAAYVVHLGCMANYNSIKRFYITRFNSDTRVILWGRDLYSGANTTADHKIMALTYDSNYVFALGVLESSPSHQLVLIALNRSTGAKVWMKSLTTDFTSAEFNYGGLVVKNGYIYVVANLNAPFNRAIFFKVDTATGGNDSIHTVEGKTFTWATSTGFTDGTDLSYDIVNVNQDDATTSFSDSTITSSVDIKNPSNANEPVRSQQII
jgi:hypothetical protein